MAFPSRRVLTLRRALVVGILLATAVVLAGVDRADPDLWGHVRYGEDVLLRGRLPATATYTYTAPDHPWVNHENLAEIVLGFVARHGGGRGLALLKALLGLATVAFVVAAGTARRLRLGTVTLIALLVALGIAPGWSFRPQLFTYAAFAALLFVLERGERPGGAPAGWLLPPLFALWANAHGGFLAGLGVLGVHLGCRALEELWRDGRAALPLAARHATLVATVAAATLVNPYGVELLVWLLRDVAPPRPEIHEWRALSPSDPLFPLFVAVGVAVLLGWWRRRRPLDLASTAVLLLTAEQTVAHARHLPLFALAAGFWLVRHANAAEEARAPRRAPGWLAPSVWALDAAVLGLLVVGARGPAVERALYPVNAFRFMAKRGLVGRVVMNFDWAQYAIAAFGDAAPVAFDGRLRTCYPQEVADVYFDFLVGDHLIPRWRSSGSPPVDGARVLELGRPDLVVVDRHFAMPVATMAARTDWTLLYQDALAQIWGRRQRFDDPRSPSYVAPAERWITEVAQSGAVPWPALPRRRTNAVRAAAGGAAGAVRS